MAILSLLEEEQLAVLGQATQLVRRSASPEFQTIRELAARVHWPIQDRLDRLKVLSEAATSTRARRDNAEGEVESGADQVHGVVADVDAWMRQLASAARLAHAAGHPAAVTLARLAKVGDGSVDSLREAEDVLAHMLFLVGQLGDPTKAYLPVGFAQRGLDLQSKLFQGDTTTQSKTTTRMVLTRVLHVQLDEVGRLLEEIALGAEHIEAVTGDSAPALELALLRGAEGKAGGARPSLPPLEPLGAAPATQPPGE